MNTDEIYDFFGSASKATKASGVKRNTFYMWVKRGYIPLLQQKKFELLTKGKLKANIKDKEVINTYFPIFKYYNKKYGMCNVETIYFKKGKNPQIIYINPKNPIEKFSTFMAQNLMQGTDILDSKGQLLYDGDICLLPTKKKIIFKLKENYSFFKKIKKFEIIGNIFEEKK